MKVKHIHKIKYKQYLLLGTELVSVTALLLTAIGGTRGQTSVAPINKIYGQLFHKKGKK